MLRKFIKYFVGKWLGTGIIENTLILCLEELVNRTDTTVDNKIFELIFKQGIESLKNE